MIARRVTGAIQSRPTTDVVTQAPLVVVWQPSQVLTTRVIVGSVPPGFAV